MKEEISGIYKGSFIKHRIVHMEPHVMEFFMNEEKYVDDSILSLDGEMGDFNKKVKDVLKELGGCYIKVEGTGANDMRNWVVDLNCTSIEDVYMILKNSIVIGDRLIRLKKEGREDF